jgi:hypothetical protein
MRQERDKRPRNKADEPFQIRVVDETGVTGHRAGKKRCHGGGENAFDLKDPVWMDPLVKGFDISVAFHGQTPRFGLFCPYSRTLAV